MFKQRRQGCHSIYYPRPFHFHNFRPARLESNLWPSNCGSVIDLAPGQTCEQNRRVQGRKKAGPTVMKTPGLGFGAGRVPDDTESSYILYMYKQEFFCPSLGVFHRNSQSAVTSPSSPFSHDKHYAIPLSHFTCEGMYYI
jgi:hypothetical protein